MSDRVREYIRDNYGPNRKKRFNIIGFPESGTRTRYYKWQKDGWTEPQKIYRHCSIHPGTRLIPVEGDTTVLQCPACGITYPIKDTVQEQNVQSEITPASKTKIISGKRNKRKFYDKFGNEITDETLIQDIMQGKTVISYHEQKQGEDKPHIVRK